MDYQKLHSLLDKTRLDIENLSNSDDERFYINRFIYARLQLDERRIKRVIKKELFEEKKSCSVCKNNFSILKGLHLHRKDSAKGYSYENCELLHSECHKKVHSEEKKVKNNISKRSKKYTNQPFLYWWDITPITRDDILNDIIKEIRLEKKDTNEYCILNSFDLKKSKLLDKEVQTTRGQGNYGIKILINNEYVLVSDRNNNYKIEVNWHF